MHSLGVHCKTQSASSIFPWISARCIYSNSKILRERTDIAHKGTLQGHGNRNNWNRNETILQLLFKSYIQNVALSSGEGGGGHLFKRTACLTLWPKRLCAHLEGGCKYECRCLNMEIWYPILLVLLFEIGLERLKIDLWSNLPDRGENRHINKKLLQSHIPYM